MIDRAKLEAKRKSVGLSKNKMAAALDVSPANYGMKERGELKFKEDEMLLITKLLDLSTGEIVEMFFTKEPDVGVSIDDTSFFDIGVLKSHLDYFDKDLEVIDEDGRKLSGYKATSDSFILMF